MIQIEWNGVELSGSKMEGKQTRPVGDSTIELIQKRAKGEEDWARNSNCITQHQVGAGGGVVVRTASTTARQCRYWRPTGDEAVCGDSHALQCRLQFMVDGGGDQTQGRGHHCLGR